MKKIPIIILFVFIFQISKSQDRYWVFFTDKNNVKFEPQEYFDAKAIERRIKNNIPIYDSTDFPVRTDYIEQINSIADKHTSTTRWFNAIAVIATNQQIQKIKKLPFVKSVKAIHTQTYICQNKEQRLNCNLNFEKLLKMQTERMQGSLFYNNNRNGQGIRIAIFDAGFPGVDKHKAFKHIRDNHNIIKTFDFARNKVDVYAHNSHGTMVLSCIAGIYDDQIMGLATQAEFLLARTEVETEPFSEEENWLEAVEWADKNGADIINSSLGYTYHRYFTFEMDGNTSLVVKAANLASNKGILVLNAMGNDGDLDWKILGTPADADSILSIGGIDPNTDYHSHFSSFGPTADKRLKPNLVAYSTAVVVAKNKITKADGTSFSTPLVTGFAACAWQSHPDLSVVQLKAELEKSGHLYPYYDYAHGYGVPQASYFTNNLKKKTMDATFQFKKNNKKTLSIIVKKEYIDTKTKNSNNYLYYNVSNKKGEIIKYWLIDVFSTNAAKINLENWDNNYIIRAHYKGYTKEYANN